MVVPSKHPMIYWAQRNATLLLTIAIEDAKVEQLEFKDNTFSFRGLDGSNQLYEVSLNLYEKVDPTTLHKADTARHIEMVIGKAEPNWWPRLLKDTTKMPWIKIDFNKWVDEEDEEEDGPNDFNFDGDLPGDFDPSSLAGLEDESGEVDDIDTPTTSGANGEADAPEVGV